MQMLHTFGPEEDRGKQRKSSTILRFNNPTLLVCPPWKRQLDVVAKACRPRLEFVHSGLLEEEKYIGEPPFSYTFIFSCKFLVFHVFMVYIIYH